MTNPILPKTLPELEVMLLVRLMLPAKEEAEIAMMEGAAAVAVVVALYKQDPVQKESERAIAKAKYRNPFYLTAE